MRQQEKILGLVGVVLTFFLGIAGLILLAIAMYGISRRHPGREIFKNFLIGNIIMFIGGLLLSFFVLSLLASPSIAVIASLVGYVLLVVGAHYLRKSLLPVGDVTGNELFRLAGNLIFWGAVATIVLVGALIVVAGWVVLGVAFFTAKADA